MVAPATSPEALKPCLADLLHTGTAPSTLLLKVEHIFDETRPKLDEEDQESANEARQGQRTASLAAPGRHLALSDGQLQIQALLAPLDHQHAVAALRPGDLIEVRECKLKCGPRANGAGLVAYLDIERFTCPDLTSITVHAVPDPNEGGFLYEEEGIAADMTAQRQSVCVTQKAEIQATPGTLTAHHHPLTVTPASSRRLVEDPATPQSCDSDEDYFDLAFVSTSQMDARRQALQRL